MIYNKICENGGDFIQIQQTIYYTDELNDEFAGDTIQAIPIDENYQYLRDNFRGKMAHIFWYHVIAKPLAWIYLKLHFGHKIINKEILKAAKHEAYFLYGNHTHFMADALIPTIVNHPKDTCVIVHPNNVSMPILGKITPYLGAMPLPDDLKATRHFLKAMDEKVREKRAIMIYPEAHIWPYYTGIRPFKNDSFRYPLSYGCATYCFTNTYQKRRFRKTPRIVTYVDGPFYPDTSLSKKEQKQNLRDQVFSTMKERTVHNNVCLVRYEKKES